MRAGGTGDAWRRRERSRDDEVGDPRAVKVDRVACPWLIRKFVDPEAEFLFVPPEQVMETAQREGATPFDVPDVELGHHRGRCSFEAIVERYGIKDPAIGAAGADRARGGCLGGHVRGARGGGSEGDRGGVRDAGAGGRPRDPGAGVRGVRRAVRVLSAEGGGPSRPRRTIAPMIDGDDAGDDDDAERHR